MDKTARTIRIATFNVYSGKDTGKIAGAIRANKNISQAEIILLQEIEAHHIEAKERAQAIADELGYLCLYAPARDVISKAEIIGTHGLAILSKFPIKDYDVVSLKEFNLRYNSRKRIALNAILEIDDQLIQVCNVHLDLRINVQERIQQAAGIIDKLNTHHIQKIVMGGDFNTVPIYWAGRVLPIFYSRQKSKFNAFVQSQGFVSRLSDIGYTMHQKLIKFSLDSIYTKSLEVTAFGVERDIMVSDHKPVWVDIQL